MQLVRTDLVPGTALPGGSWLRYLFQPQRVAVKFLRRRFEFGRSSDIYMMQLCDHYASIIISPASYKHSAPCIYGAMNRPHSSPESISLQSYRVHHLV